MIKNRKDIFSIIKQNQEKIESLGVERIGLFGSYVKQKQQPKSDIDILVEFRQKEKTFDNFLKLSFFLEDLLEKNIELVTVESISPYIKSHIINEVEYVFSRN